MICLTDGKLTMTDGKLTLGAAGRTEHAPDIVVPEWHPAHDASALAQPVKQPEPAWMADQVVTRPGTIPPPKTRPPDISISLLQDKGEGALYANGALVVHWIDIADSEDSPVGSCETKAWTWEDEYETTSTGHTKSKIEYFGGMCDIFVIRHGEDGGGRRTAQVTLTGGRARVTMESPGWGVFHDVMLEPYSMTFDLVQGEANTDSGATLLLT